MEIIIKNLDLILKKLVFYQKITILIVNDLTLDKNNKLMKVDKIDLDYFDNSNVKNKFVLNRIKNNNYELNGSTLNADTIITNLLDR